MELFKIMVIKIMDIIKIMEIQTDGKILAEMNNFI